jgi:hypothetical protein
MITEKEYKQSKIRVILIHVMRFTLSFITLLSVASLFFVLAFPWLIPFALFVPSCIALKYLFNVKGIWILNDHEGGDFGEKWWLDKKGLKPGLWSAILWWFRNHCWNFYKLFNPDWNNGEVYEYEIRINTTNIPESETIWVWCSKYATKKNPPIYGEHLILYRVYKGGKAYFRHSKATPEKEFQFGCGGNEYRIRKKPLF